LLPWPGIAAVPAEPLRALVQARHEPAAAERSPTFRVICRLVEDSQFDGIDLEGVGELVDRRLEREQPWSLAGARTERGAGMSSFTIR
jgi:hypothetical protein